VSVTSRIASRSSDRAIFAINAATTTAAAGSRMGKPIRAPAIPASAATDERASDRWCQALVTTSGLPYRRPTRRVTWKSASLTTMLNAAAHSVIAAGSTDSPNRLHASQAIPTAAPRRTTARATVPRVS
jgi:hypothetical protein